VGSINEARPSQSAGVVRRGRTRTQLHGPPAKLNVSQSALSHTIRELEERLGVRLLTRTTRSVSPTEAGERLLRNIGPRFDEIETELAAVRELREKPAGSIRITATEFAIDTVLLPKLAPMLREYPDLKVEMIVDYGLTDIVAQQYDAGVRSGEQVAKDMIAVRIGPDMRMSVVSAPAYFERHSEPKRPQDLVAHNCINLRLPTHGGVYAWEFERGSRELRVRVEGQLTFNGTAQLLHNNLKTLQKLLFSAGTRGDEGRADHVRFIQFPSEGRGRAGRRGSRTFWTPVICLVGSRRSRRGASFAGRNSLHAGTSARCSGTPSTR
jgi:hypothetical protein